MKKLLLSLAAAGLLYLGLPLGLGLAVPGEAAAAACNDTGEIYGEIRYDDGLGHCYIAVVASDGTVKTTAAGAGSTSNASSAVATSSTNGATVNWNYGFNGTTWDQLQVDASKFLKVNCATGCSGGTFNNNADAVATSATNGQSASWLYGFNGTTWDRLQVDASKFLKVTIAAQSLANITMNETQVSGTAVSVNNGVVDAGTQRVTLASNGTGVVGLATGANTIGALTANQSVNVAQVNGVTTLTGTGAQGTGAQRVTVATDSATVAGSATLPAGANIIGKVGIDQTTDITTNGVEIAPTAASAAGITPVVSASLESGHILKASAGNLYSVTATVNNNANGQIMVFNSTTVPADGAVTPIECINVNAGGTVSINPGMNGPPEQFSTGISVAFSSAGSCFSKTASANAFFNGKIK